MADDLTTSFTPLMEYKIAPDHSGILDALAIDLINIERKFEEMDDEEILQLTEKVSNIFQQLSSVRINIKDLTQYADLMGGIICALHYFYTPMTSKSVGSADLIHAENLLLERIKHEAPKTNAFLTKIKLNLRKDFELSFETFKKDLSDLLPIIDGIQGQIHSLGISDFIGELEQYVYQNKDKFFGGYIWSLLMERASSSPNDEQSRKRYCSLTTELFILPFIKNLSQKYMVDEAETRDDKFRTLMKIFQDLREAHITTSLFKFRLIE